MAFFDLLSSGWGNLDKESKAKTDRIKNSLSDLQTASESEYKEYPLRQVVSDSREAEEEVSLAPPRQFEDPYLFEVLNAEEKLYQL